VSATRETQWLRTDARGRPVGVDREAEVIRGYVVAQEGPFKSEGRGEFDKQALREIVRLMKAAPNGLKVRFAHPSLSSDGIGRLLGRARSPRLDKISTRESKGELLTNEITVVRADLHFDASARITPSGDLTEYVMTLAESDPDAFSSSLVVMKEEEYRIDKRGRPATDKEGNELPPLWRPLKLHASDVVDTGDAVDGFLSSAFAGLPDRIVRQAAALVDEQFPNADRDELRTRLTGWLDRYLELRFGPEPPTEPEPPPDEPRRLGRLQIAPELMANLGSGTFRVIAGDVGECRVLRTRYDAERDLIELMLESPAFEPVAPGAIVPVVETPQIQRLEEPPADDPPAYDPRRDPELIRLRRRRA